MPSTYPLGDFLGSLCSNISCMPHAGLCLVTPGGGGQACHLCLAGKLSFIRNRPLPCATVISAPVAPELSRNQLRPVSDPVGLSSA